MTAIESILRRLPSSRLSLMMLILAGIAPLAGCSLMSVSNQEIIAADAPLYQIQVIPMLGRPTVKKLAIKDNMTVEDAIKESGAPSRFRGMEITLSRVLKKDSQVLRMPIQWEYETGSVIRGHNYSLHPGDSISIRAKQAGTIEKMISSMTGGAL